MTGAVHQLQIGDIACAVLHEGGSAMPAEQVAGMFPSTPPSEIEAALAGVSTLIGSLNCLYIDNGSHKLLVDVGFGPSRQPELGNVIPALGSIGVAPADIDMIFFTHFHGDHVVGIFAEDGSPAYPNARYMATQAEWDEWLPKWDASDDDATRQRADAFRAMQDQWTLVDDGATIIDGVSVVLTAGHTLGHAAVLVESGDEKFIHLADVLHRDPQFGHPHWQFRYDTDGDMAAHTRQTILGRCADEGLLTMFYHLAFPGIGRITRAGDAFAWHPMQG